MRAQRSPPAAPARRWPVPVPETIALGTARPPAGRGGADSSVRRLVARAASPGERAAWGGLASEDDAPSDDACVPAWVADLQTLLTDTESDDDGAPTPFLAGEIVSADVLAQTGMDANTVWSFDAIFAPLVRTANGCLDRIIASGPYAVAPGASRRFLAQLVRRWWMVSAQLLTYRLQAADLLTEHGGGLGHSIQRVFFGAGRPGRAHWDALWRAYPVAARLFAVVFHNWRCTTAELLDRVHRDATLLDEVFVSSGSLGALCDVRGDAGDLHAHGRSVAILTFENGARIVYKPKDLRIAAAYTRLIQDLNDAGITPPLHVRKIVTRGAYAWEEYVAAAPCNSEEDIRCFYRRIGMYARLLQLTDGTDFTMDNVVAHGAHPVLVDLEMLLSPRMAHAADRTVEARVIAGLTWDFPTRCGLITAKIAGEPGRRAAEVGALAPASCYEAPFKQTMARRDAHGTLRVVEDYAMLPGNRATPVLNGSAVGAAGYFGEVEDGYRSMAACLKRHASWLVRPGGALAAMARAPVRYLCRDTHIYSRILQESVAPRALRDGEARERCLRRLAKARFDTPEIVRSEIDALRDFDVPLFAALPCSDAIILEDGSEVGGIFDGAVHPRVLERLASMSARTDDEEADAIRTALFIRDPAVPAGGALRHPAAIAGSAWLEAAAVIGEEVAARAIIRGDDTVSWIGLTYDPHRDAWSVGRLGDDLATGAAGLAIVFADLNRATGVTRFADLARRAATSLQARLADVTTTLRSGGSSAAARADALRCGGPFGWAGWSYACSRVARTLDEPRLADDPSARLSSQAIEALCAGSPLGAACGMAGLALALVRHGDGRATHTTLAAARIAAALARCDENRDGATSLDCASSGWPMTELPDDRSGAIAALLALLRSGLGTEPHASAPDADCNAMAARLWRESDDTGTAGAVLSRLLIGHLAPVFAARAQRDADLAIRALQCANTSRHLLAAAEIAITAYQVSRRSRFYDTACELANRLIARRRLRGTWFPASLAADRYNLSAMSGISAVAHLMLKLHAPDHVASLRLMQ